MKSFSTLFTLSLALSALAIPAPQATQSFTKQNGEDAISLNKQFATLTPDSSCSPNEDACVNQQFAQCVSNKFVLTPCGSGLICAALPLVNKAGTSVTCTTQSDVDSRIAATGATDDDSSDPTSSSGDGSDDGSGDDSSSSSGDGSNDNSGDSDAGSSSVPAASSTKGSSTTTASAASSTSTDLQLSLCLAPSLLQKGFEQNGQETPAAGQVASLTSSNNFINFCATVPNLPLTNGQQVKGGSCNAAPMGIIASVNNIPSAKFQSPQNLDTIKANTSFTVNLAIKHLNTGNFVNADANYFSAPQQIDDSGDVTGHSHIVIESINGLKDTNPPDPTKFAFFKGVNTPATNGVLSVTVSTGLPPGTYRMSTINTAANHQPVLVAVAQHGSIDDVIYFTVTEDGKPSSDNGSGSNNDTDSSGSGSDDGSSNNNDSSNNTNSNGNDNNSSKSGSGSSDSGSGKNNKNGSSNKSESGSATTSSVAATSTVGSNENNNNDSNSKSTNNNSSVVSSDGSSSTDCM